MQVTSDKTRPRADSVERTLEVVGDAWTFRVLREAFFGAHRFDEFRRGTGASPNILTDRLKKLVAHGIFEKVRYSDHANRFEYRLTEMGIDLYPLIVLMLQWGDRWLDDGKGPPLTLVHEACGNDLQAELVCAQCDGVVDARAVSWVNNRPGED